MPKNYNGIVLFFSGYFVQAQPSPIFFAEVATKAEKLWLVGLSAGRACAPKRPVAKAGTMLQSLPNSIYDLRFTMCDIQFR